MKCKPHRPQTTKKLSQLNTQETKKNLIFCCILIERFSDFFSCFDPRITLSLSGFMHEEVNIIELNNGRVVNTWETLCGCSLSRNRVLWSEVCKIGVTETSRQLPCLEAWRELAVYQCCNRSFSTLVFFSFKFYKKLNRLNQSNAKIIFE